MAGISLRGITKKEIADIPPEKLIELEKTRLDIERLRIGKQLDGENLSNLKQARTWCLLIAFILTILLSFFSLPKIISQRYALKNGYCLIDGNIIAKENVPLALEYQYAKKLAGDAKMSLTLPYLTTYISDEKNIVPINEQILKSLTIIKKEITVPEAPKK